MLPNDKAASPAWALRRGRVQYRQGSTVPVDSRHASSPAAELSKLLVGAKFSVPQPRPGTVSHSELVEKARSSGCRLVAVTAPAGYGKSTFLAEWAAAEDRRVAWVSLDRFDDDPAMLLVSLAAAYYRAGLGGADLVADMGGPGVSAAWPRRAAAGRRIPRQLRSRSSSCWMIFTSCSHLTCHDVLTMVISAIPRWVSTGRRKPFRAA